MKRLRHLLAGVAALALLPGLAWAQTNDGLKQQTVRAATGTAYDYDGDWSALFDKAGIAPGPFNQRLLAWINGQLSSSYTDINDAEAAFAVSQGAPSWSALGTFTISGGGPVISTSPGVLFDYDTILSTSNALTGGDATRGFIAYWYKGNYDKNNDASILNGATVYSNGNTFFNGSISAGVLTLSSMISGTIQIGDQLTAGVGQSSVGAPYIAALASGTLGAPGSTYTLGGTSNNVSTEVIQASGKCEVTASPPGAAAPGFCISYDNSVVTPQININDAAGLTSGTDDIKFNGVNGKTVFNSGQWNFYLFAWDTAAGDSAVVFNGVQQLGTGGAGAFVNVKLSPNAAANLSNPGGLAIGEGSNATMEYAEMSDMMIDNTSIICSGAGQRSDGTTDASCTTADTVSPAVLATMWSSGQPVDYGTNCATPLGHQPIGCFRFRNPANLGLNEGSGAAMALSVNYGAGTGAQGSGGASAGPELFPSPYPPSGAPAHQATPVFVDAQRAATITSNTMTLSLGGWTPVAGHLAVIIAETGNSSTNPGTFTCPTGGTNTWTKLEVADTSEHMDTAVCYTFLQSGDVSGTWSIVNSASGTRLNSWTYLEFANVASVDQATSLFNSTATGSPKTAAAGANLTTAANETLVEIMGEQSVSHQLSFPGGCNGLYRLPYQTSSARPQTAVCYKYGAPSGTDVSMTYQLVSGTDTFAGFALSLVPK